MFSLGRRCGMAQSPARFPIASRPDPVADRIAASPGLRLSAESQDETTLRQFSTDELVIRRTRDRSNLMRLWEACRPRLRKTTQDEHARLIGTMFEHLTQGDRRLPKTGCRADREPRPIDGDIDALSCDSRGCAPWLTSPIALIGSPTHKHGKAARETSKTGFPTRCTNR